MRVKFAGVGEAFDENYPNTSLLLRTQQAGQTYTILLDCGFTAPPAVWRDCPDPEEIDAIWISHFHGDHYFGLPALLTRFWEMKRKKPLLIVGQEGIDTVVSQATRLAYPSILEKLPFTLRFASVEPGHILAAVGCTWRTAENGHPQRDLAVRIDDGEKTLFYSGDGLATEASLALARGCDLIVHEAFTFDRNLPAHGNVVGCIDFAAKAGARMLALVHIARDERRGRREHIMRAIGSAGRIRVLIPEPGDEVEL